MRNNLQHLLSLFWLHASGLLLHSCNGIQNRVNDLSHILIIMGTCISDLGDTCICLLRSVHGQVLPQWIKYFIIISLCQMIVKIFDFKMARKVNRNNKLLHIKIRITNALQLTL